MSAKYLLTDIGRGIIRDKISQSEKLVLKKVVFGDKATDLTKEISVSDTDLINPRIESPIERLYYLQSENPTEIHIKLSSVISESITDKIEMITIREYGIYDNENNLIFIGECNPIPTKIDTDPRDILFDLIISLNTSIKVIKPVIGTYAGLSPELEKTINDLVSGVELIDQDLVKIKEDIISLKNLNPDSDFLKELSDTISEMATNFEKRITDLENNSGNVDLTDIENRLKALEDNSGNNGGEGTVVTYTNENLTPVDVGGIPKGSSFKDATIKDMFDMLLYPYQAPSFSFFKVNNQASLNLEVGQTFSGEVTFTWDITNKSNFKEGSIVCNNVPVPANATSTKQNIELKYNVPNSHVFNISALDSKDVTFKKSITLSWLFKRYFGPHANDTITDAEVLALSNDLGSNKNKSYTYDCTGGKYFYYAYPSSFGDLNNIIVNKFSWNDFTLVKREIINANGISVPINIYRSNNKLNGSVTVDWS